MLVRGYVDRVLISCAAEVIARHKRSYEREDLVFDPLHYLPLIERKVGALDQAAPLRGWDLPEAFATLRRLLEARMGPRNHGAAGKREYVQVLRLLESFPLGEVETAIREALRLGAIGFDAIKHLLLCRIERRPPRLDLDVYPYLPKAHVETTSAKAYMRLDRLVAAMSETPQILLAHHLKKLKLPTFLREHEKIARLCAAENMDHTRYLLRLAELELIDREGRMVERRIKAARFPTVKSLDSFDFKAIPSLNKTLVLDASTSIAARTSSRSATQEPACRPRPGARRLQKGLSVGFITAAALVHELMEARDDKLLRFQARRIEAPHHRRTGLRASLQDRRRVGSIASGYERGSILVTSNLPFDEWTEVFGSERLTGALLDRLTQRHIIEMNGESFRLKQSKTKNKSKPTERHPLDPEGPQVPPTRHGLCPMIGRPSRARDPPVDFGDKLLTVPKWYTFTPPRGRFLLRR